MWRTHWRYVSTIRTWRNTASAILLVSVELQLKGPSPNMASWHYFGRVFSKPFPKVNTHNKSWLLTRGCKITTSLLALQKTHLPFPFLKDHIYIANGSFVLPCIKPWTNSTCELSWKHFLFHSSGYINIEISKCHDLLLLLWLLEYVVHVNTKLLWNACITFDFQLVFVVLLQCRVKMEVENIMFTLHTIWRQHFSNVHIQDKYFQKYNVFDDSHFTNGLIVIISSLDQILIILNQRYFYFSRDRKSVV